ncbi:MAG: YbbR-like domain-containing protein [Sediminibacterium sp.]|nr:YbbR-like domain-containing protein [Sediminibacterium sp.]
MSVLKKNKPVKTTAFFICVCIAGFLWLIHNLNRTYNYTLQVPVVFSNLPALKLPAQPLPDKVTLSLKLSGLKIFLLKLQKPQKPIQIDFNQLKSDARKQVYSIASNARLFQDNLPMKPEVLQTLPDSLVFIEKKGWSKNVPVKALLHTKAATGYVIEELVVSPGFVTAYGDSATLKQLDTLYTEPLVYNQLSQPVNRGLSIINPHPTLVINTTSVQISIQTAKLLDHEIHLPVQVLNTPQGCVARCFPQQVKVKYTAPHADHEQLQLINVSVNAGKAIKSKKKAPVEISTKTAGIHILEILPEEVELIILKK